MEGCRKKFVKNIRYEGDAKGENNFKEIGSFSDELKGFTTKIKKSLFG